MNHWLVKQEPESYPWEQFVADKRTIWNGVRNFQARNNLRAMKRGDAVLFYASGGPKCVVGLARVSKTAFPDPTATDGDWTAVELEADTPLRNPVPLAAIKETRALEGLLLIRHTRLSVMPVSKSHFDAIIKLGGGRA